ncbi:MAG: hypothetical protein JWP51_1027 [Bradyrhizobium sp.]|jgi:hypothetical protein|nr:hypothetical protein [Bradyrhizobium sp.]
MIAIQIDTSKLAAWAEQLSVRGMRNAIRRAVDQSVRAARKTTVPVIAADIGVSKAKIAAAVQPIQSIPGLLLTFRFPVLRRELRCEVLQRLSIDAAPRIWSQRRR